MRATLALVLAGALLAGCSSSDQPDGAAEPTAPATTEATDAATALKGRPVGVADVGGVPWFVLVAAGAVDADGTRVPVGNAPLRIVETPAGVWVSVIGDGTVVRIDPSTGKVDRRVRLEPEGSEPEGLAWDGESLWVVDQANDRVVQLDGNGTLLGEQPVGQAPRLVAAGETGTWVANYGGTSVTRIADGTAETVPVVGCIGAQGVAEAAGHVFVSCTMAHKVVVLDAASLEVVGEIPDVTDADAVVADGTTVYVVGQSGPTVWAIDAASRDVTGVTRLGDTGATAENVGAAVVGSDLVVTHPDTGFYTLPTGG